ncbi:MAG TPA: N-acetylmuramoyl-L-alanine amidase [Kiritimatiellia bacterium]|nr:N-acetylmuramoyl-L-alanine amidase [Kiritimatiellia bacterium]
MNAYRLWFRWALVVAAWWGMAVIAAASAIRPVTYQGERYVRLEDLAGFYGGTLEPSPGTDRVTLQTRWADAVFRPDSRELRIGGTLVWLHDPMTRVRGSWALREGDALHVVDPIMRPAEHLRRAGSRIVVLDPGHGGADTGAKGKRGVEEKRAALDITRRVRSHLIAAGIKVYLTRDNDRFIELEERARMARRWNADLFVSIHLNSAASTTAQGIETFVLAAEGFSSTAGGSRSAAAPGNQHNALNSALGFQIHRAVLQQTSAPDRGLKRARFIVLRNAACPSVLIECGFLSHPEEEKKMMTEAYREELARGIARGILNYVNLARRAQRETAP